jgi:hypothetical protein
MYDEDGNHSEAVQRLSPEALKASGLQIATFELE